MDPMAAPRSPANYNTPVFRLETRTGLFSPLRANVQLATPCKRRKNPECTTILSSPFDTAEGDCVSSATCGRLAMKLKPLLLAQRKDQLSNYWRSWRWHRHSTHWLACSAPQARTWYSEQTTVARLYSCGSFSMFSCQSLQLRPLRRNPRVPLRACC